MPCEGCPGSHDLELAKMRAKAKQYAVEKMDTVIIYKEIGYGYCLAPVWFASPIGQYVEAVSKLP
jgi:hypothetical protein